MKRNTCRIQYIYGLGYGLLPAWGLSSLWNEALPCAQQQQVLNTSEWLQHMILQDGCKDVPGIKVQAAPCPV